MHVGVLPRLGGGEAAQLADSYMRVDGSRYLADAELY